MQSMYVHQVSPSTSVEESKTATPRKLHRTQSSVSHTNTQHFKLSAAEDGISKGKVSLENSNQSEDSSSDGSQSKTHTTNRSKKANLKRKDKKRKLNFVEESAIASEDEEESFQRTRSK